MDTSDRTILRRLTLGLTLVILVGVVVWVFFVRDNGKKNTSNKNTTTQQTADKNNQSQSGSSSQQGSETKPQGNPAPSDGSKPTAGQPNTLADTGPGNVALLFVGAAAVGTLSHHLYSRRRAKAI